MVLWCCSNPCKVQYKHWVETPLGLTYGTQRRSNVWKQNTNIELRHSPSLTFGTLMSLKCIQKRSTNIELRQSLAWPMAPWCHSNACPAQYRHWVETVPRLHLWYPDVAQVHVERNTTLLRQSPGLTYDILASLKCMQNAIQTLSWDNPAASFMVPWCRSTACKTQCTRWVETIPRPHWWYHYVAQMRVKKRFKHWVETIPRPHLWWRKEYRERERERLREERLREAWAQRGPLPYIN